MPSGAVTVSLEVIPSHGKSRIQDLPVELLEYIMGFINASDDRNLIKAALVCRAFNTAAVPFIYKTISLTVSPLDMHLVKLEQLQNTLVANPRVLEHCEEVQVTMDDWIRNITNDTFESLRTVVANVPRTTKVDINGGFEDHPNQTWKTIRRALQHMANISSLCLTQILTAGLDVAALADNLSNTFSLRLLELSSFTSLTLDDFDAQPETAMALIQWAKSLEHFSFIDNWRRDVELDIPMITDWLSIYTASLKSINLGYMSPTGRGTVFNSSKFTALESLSISIIQLQQPNGRLVYLPQTVEMLSAPRLKTIIITHPKPSWNPDYPPLIPAFNGPEESWIRNLAQDAVRTKSSLQKIVIAYSASLEPKACLPVNVYPWDRMQGIAACMQSQGLTLVYHGSQMPREKWDRAMARVTRVRDRLRHSQEVNDPLWGEEEFNRDLESAGADSSDSQFSGDEEPNWVSYGDEEASYSDEEPNWVSYGDDDEASYFDEERHWVPYGDGIMLVIY
ncbi:hypothetical protein BJX99DRAFT_256723 [Aspergillus californicus]